MAPKNCPELFYSALRSVFLLNVINNFVAYGIGTMPVKKYATAEEKVKAIQEYQRRYHEQHRDELRARALEAYHAARRAKAI